MNGPDPAQTPNPMRRRLITGAALLAGGAAAMAAGLTPRPADAARPKLPQADIGYQATPKGGQRCDQCVNWQPPAACKVIAGQISPMGWCSLFVRRA